VILTRGQPITGEAMGRPLALAAVAGPMLLTAAWVVLGLVSPGYTLWGVRVTPYSAISQPVSGLGLGPTGPYMNAAFVASGILLIAGAFGIVTSIRGLSPRASRVCTVLLALPGVGCVLDGVFTFESFFLHFVGFLLALTTVAGFPIVGRVIRRIPDWRPLGTWLIVAGPLTLVLAALYFATFTPTIEGIQVGVAGLTERILIIELQAWYVVMGWLAFRRPRIDRPVML
jgi:hypothetical membrane protein